MSTEFALFECNLPNASCSIRVEGGEARHPTQLVKTARDACWHAQFDYAPIKRGEIRALAKPVDNFQGMLDALPSIKVRSLKNELEAFTETPEKYSGKGDFRDFAASYYLYSRFAPAFDIAVPKQESNAGGARFAANTGAWRIVKKALVGVQPEETMAGLVGIFHSASRKLGELSGADVGEVNALVKQRFKRKSFSSLLPYLESLPEMPALAREYAALKGFEAAGAAPFILIQTANKCYPQFKIPKPKGRLPKA